MTIPLVFFTLAGLILWFIIGSRGHWLLKASVISITLYLCLSVGASIPNFAGWPSDDRLPDKFLVHWILVNEPDKKTKEDGDIYIWASTLSGPKEQAYGWWKRYLLSFAIQDPDEPRSYRTPYSTEAHKTAGDAVGKIKAGGSVVGRNNGKGGGSGDGEGGKGGKGANGDSGKGQGKGGGSFSRSDDISFHDLPDTVLPDKD